MRTETSPRTLEIPKQAGWYPGRRFDTTDSVWLLQTAGYESITSRALLRGMEVGMERFSPRTADALSAAGWYPGRQVDTSDAERILRHIGFKILPSAVEFLREFGGLSITYRPSPPQVLEVGVEEWLAEYYLPSEVHLDDLRTEGPVTHIGTVQNGEVKLLMNGAGKVFGMWSGIWWVAGTSGDDALEGLGAGRRWSEIP